MKKQAWMIVALGMALAVAAAQKEPKPAPSTFPLECTGGDCVLLKGVPQTSGVRGGSVRLKPGESIGWHSTGENEEALTILRGTGVAAIENLPDVLLHEKILAYIPPGTRHNVTNNGQDALEYVWIVAPTKT